MTQETSPDFAYPLSALIAPYVPSDEVQRLQTRSLVDDAITRAGKESRARDWQSLTPDEQVTTLASKLPPVERVAQAAILLFDNQPQIESWGEEHKRTFLGKVVEVDKGRIKGVLKDTIPTTDPRQADKMRARAQRKIAEYDSLLLKLQARTTPNGPARK